MVRFDSPSPFLIDCLFSVAANSTLEGAPPTASLRRRIAHSVCRCSRPVASRERFARLCHLPPNPMQVSRTCTSPLERLKIMFQIQQCVQTIPCAIADCGAGWAGKSASTRASLAR